MNGTVRKKKSKESCYAHPFPETIDKRDKGKIETERRVFGVSKYEGKQVLNTSEKQPLIKRGTLSAMIFDTERRASGSKAPSA